MRYLAVTVTAMLCALMLHHSTALTCFKCGYETQDGKVIHGDASCEDPFSGTTTMTCNGTDFCGKVVIKETVVGGTDLYVWRACMSKLVKSDHECAKPAEVKGTSETTSDGKTLKKTTEYENCCHSDNCNGAPSVTYTSKIFVSVLGLLLIFFYSY